MDQSGKSFYYCMISLLVITLGLAVYLFMKAFQYDFSAIRKTDFDKPDIHLLLISQKLDSPYWRLIEQGARKAAEERGVALEYSGPVQPDIKEHIKIIEMAIASGVDGILTQGLNDREFTPVINYAMEMNIPVISVDTDAPNSNRLVYVGTDNYFAGYRVGKALIKESGGHANVGIITGSFAADNQASRVEGFQDAVKDEPGIRILDVEESNLSRSQAAEKAYQIMEKYPVVDTFYGTSSLDGLGISQALDYIDKKPDEGKSGNKRIKIYAFDDLPETLDLIEQGIIDATVVQKPFMMGEESVKLMLDHLNGKKIVTTYNTDATVVGKADLPLYRNGGQE